MTKGELFIELVKYQILVAALLGHKEMNLGEAAKKIEDTFFAIFPEERTKK